MTRKFFLIFIFAVLPLSGCNKIKLPFLNKKKAVEATPAPKPAVAAAATPVPSAPPTESKPAEPPKPEVNLHASVIVLCYHRFEERPQDLVIKPAEFEAQMQAIKENGFSVISMRDFLGWRRSEKNIPAKSCIITLDDGWRSGYDIAWPILKKFGYPFTMFIYTNYVKGQPMAGGQSISWEELAEMRDAGVDIECHTVSHQNLRQKRGKFQNAFPTYEAWLRHELGDSKTMLEKQLGISVAALAYPYGNHSEEVRAIAREVGYEACFTVYGQRITHSSPADQLGRYAVDSLKPKIFADAMKMIGGGAGPGDTGASSVAQFAAASMVTQPMEGETITDPRPVLKANLATLGEIDPDSVEIRLSGIGAIPVTYDPATKTAQAQVTQKLREKNYTVILSAKVKGRKTETRWSFNFDPNATPASSTTPAAPPAGDAKAAAGR